MHIRVGDEIDTDHIICHHSSARQSHDRRCRSVHRAACKHRTIINPSDYT